MLRVVKTSKMDTYTEKIYSATLNFTQLPEVKTPKVQTGMLKILIN